MRIGIYILCFNVGERIAKVLRELPSDVYQAVTEIIIIDNCSTDNSISCAKKAISERGMLKVNLLQNPRNYGYGGSQKIALDYFSSRHFDYAVLFHGDGQGDLEALRKLIEIAQQGKYDFVVGSRFLDKRRLNSKYSFIRRLGNYFFIWLQSAVSGLKITDPGSGEIAIRLDYLKDIPFHKLTDEFHFTPQLFLYCARKNPKIYEFPLAWGEEEVSSVSLWKHGWQMLRMLLSYSRP